MQTKDFEAYDQLYGYIKMYHDVDRSLLHLIDCRPCKRLEFAARCLTPTLLSLEQQTHKPISNSFLTLSPTQTSHVKTFFLNY